MDRRIRQGLPDDGGTPSSIESPTSGPAIGPSGLGRGDAETVTSGPMSASPYRFTAALAEALAAGGVRHACITPGSRSTPVVIPLADHPAITDWSHHDERSSSFFALGLAAATGSPVVVVTTSGTAAAELHPAVVEAHLGRIPLVVITADRPGELRDVGAPQAVDQARLFGTSAKWSLDADAADGSSGAFPASLGARLVTVALEDPPGPVHLNLRLREPLVPDGEPGPLPVAPRVSLGRRAPDDDAMDALAASLEAKRTLIVCGPQRDPHLAEAVAGLAARLAAPIAADPLSLVRAGRHDLSHVVAAADLLAGAGWLDASPPQAVIRIGALPTSKALWTWLAAHPEVPQIVLDTGGWRDPLASASEVIRADPAAAVRGITARIGDAAPQSWKADWAHADRTARAALDDALAAESFPNEPGAVRLVVDALPEGSVLWTSSSMPIRDLDLVLPATGRDIVLWGNRGANGIDGFISTGLGSAAAALRPTYVLAGDLSVVHDLTALATAARLDIPVTIVVIDNDGGGIFHLLPQASTTSHFEKHFGTPHGLDLVRVAEAMGVAAVRITTRTDLEAAVAVPPTAPRLVVVPTDRTANVEVHRRIRSAVAAALRSL